MSFIRTMHLKGFLSFGPESQPIQLTPLNVLIGPNGAGKSNFIEALELLHAAPTDLSEPIRLGGTTREWLWKGEPTSESAIVTTNIEAPEFPADLKYSLTFTEAASRIEILDEVLEESSLREPNGSDVTFYYRFQKGQPLINVRQEQAEERVVTRKMTRVSLKPGQSVLSQMRSVETYPEITQVASKFGQIQIFREWSFGRSAPLRQSQPANLPENALLPNLVNLGLVLNDLEHRDQWQRFLSLMKQFLPRFNRMTTRIQGGAVQIYLHESGLKTPVAATRLSDGTIRFLTLLGILLNPDPTPLLCIEEPELGLHPDALAIVADLLVEASQRCQVIVSTHSDVLVSALTRQADSVLVAEYLSNGTEFRRLESEKLRYWLEKYRLGELWRIGQIGGNL